MDCDKIGIFVSGKIYEIAYEMNVADGIASELKKQFPNKNVSVRYI